MEGIKNLIVDLGGVLVNLTVNRCIEAFEQLGIADVRENVVSNFQHKNLFVQFELGRISTSEFREGIRNLAGCPLSDDQIDAAWIAMLDDIPAYKLDLLLHLRQTYNTFLLSNTNELHWEWIARRFFHRDGYEASDYFHKIYLSYELHMQKPDAEIFRYVLADASIRPQETLFIDDALPNCRTAEELALRTYAPQPCEDWSHLFR